MKTRTIKNKFSGGTSSARCATTYEDFENRSTDKSHVVSCLSGVEREAKKLVSINPDTSVGNGIIISFLGLPAWLQNYAETGAKAGHF